MITIGFGVAGGIFAVRKINSSIEQSEWRFISNIFYFMIGAIFFGFLGYIIEGLYIWGIYPDLSEKNISKYMKVFLTSSISISLIFFVALFRNSKPTLSSIKTYTWVPVLLLLSIPILMGYLASNGISDSSPFLIWICVLAVVFFIISRILKHRYSIEKNK